MRQAVLSALHTDINSSLLSSTFVWLTQQDAPPHPLPDLRQLQYHVGCKSGYNRTKAFEDQVVNRSNDDWHSHVQAKSI